MMTSSQKIFKVLEFLCAKGPHKALEISKTLDLQKSSVHRFLNSLIEFGYVRKDERSGTFSATLKVAQLGAMASRRFDLVETGRNYMRDILARYDQASISFGTLIDKQVFVVRREIPANTIIHLDMNQEIPAYCTGIGKALLSTWKEEEIDEYIRTVPRTPFTSKTLVDGQQLKASLMEAKINGYAQDEGELYETLHCVAVPIITANGGPWALSLSAHSAIVREYGVENIIQYLKQTVWNMTSGCNIDSLA